MSVLSRRHLDQSHMSRACHSTRTRRYTRNHLKDSILSPEKTLGLISLANDIHEQLTSTERKGLDCRTLEQAPLVRCKEKRTVIQAINLVVHHKAIRLNIPHRSPPVTSEVSYVRDGISNPLPSPTCSSMCSWLCNTAHSTNPSATLHIVWFRTRGSPQFSSCYT